MVKSIKTFLIAFFVIISSIAIGQVQPKSELRVGDHLPDILIKGFINDTAAKIKLKTLYQNKLLILDFWATWCTPCIKGLKVLDTLQRDYGEKINIIGVGYETNKQITDFFKIHSNRPEYLKIMVNEKTLTTQLFPHRSLPHLVWIDSTGKVIAITVEDYVTKDRINQVLSGKTLNLRQKRDNLTFKPNEPFHLMDTSFLCRSLLTGYADGVLSYDGTFGSVPGKTAMHTRKFYSNSSIRYLYWAAAYNHTINNRNTARVIFEVKDSLRYFEPGHAPNSFKNSSYKSWTEWAVLNAYCYDLKLANFTPDSILSKYMIDDLNRYLGLNGRFEHRRMNCYILKSIGDNSGLYQKGNSEPSIKYEVGKPIILQGQTVNKLVDILNEFLNNGIIVNETGIKNLIDFNLKKLLAKSPLTYSQINDSLKESNLVLDQEERDVSVFVVSEIK